MPTGTKNIEHCHSMYSLFDSTQTPDELVCRAAEMGVENIALTDHGTLLGINAFMQAGKEYGVNTIPGVEAYCNNRAHLILIAKNYEGYRSISFAMRDANEHIVLSASGKLSFPIMTNEILEKYFYGNKNVIATSACIQGSISQILLTNRRNLRRIAKDRKKCEELQPSVDKFQELNSSKLKLDSELKAAKKELTSVSKFTKPTHKKKIETLKSRLSKLDPSSSKYIDIEGKLRNAQMSLEYGETMTPSLEMKVEEMKAKKKEITSELSQVKKERDKYLKAKSKVDSVKIYSEDVLYKEAKSQLLYLKKIFPNFYVELQNHGLADESYVMPILVRLAEETSTPLIAANDAHMKDCSGESIEARRIMRFNYFNSAQKIDDADRELYLKSDDELKNALAKVVGNEKAGEAIKNLSVLEDCRVVFPEDSHYPTIQDDITIDSLVASARNEMINNGVWTEEYQERMERELPIIKEMGYVDYHLVVFDFCNAARLLGKIPKSRLHEIDDVFHGNFKKVFEWVKREQFNDGIGVGPGRGSAAGSLICYMLGITHIDPIKYGLLFERFLNPERVSMPDIDTDIATSLRPYVIRYLKWKYGERAVCSIVTETTYAAKGAIKMAGRDRASQLYSGQEEEVRIYNKDHSYLIADSLPDGAGITLSDYNNDYYSGKLSSKKTSNRVDSLYNGNLSSDEENNLIWERAKLIEGRLFGTGVHAGGVIISDNDNVNEYIPLAWNEENQVWVAQCDMVQAEERGLLKMDLLGLNTLDCISDAISNIKKYHSASIEIENVPFEPEVFESIYSAGLTNSVFQFESEGMKSMLKQFKPSCFEDLILLVAAYRPGPMQYLEEIINVKNGVKPLEFKHALLKPILSNTYGACIYQEQVMRIFQDLAGYSLGGADLVRRAMSKKKLKVLAHERESFINGDQQREIEGCIKRGVSKEIANEIFDEMMDFARYAFNKSHAAAYAYVSYWTAWLKYHYPTEFLCAMFNNKDQTAYDPLLKDCLEYHISLLPPDINSSYYDFTIEEKGIRYGIKGIKNIGKANKSIIETMCEERKKRPYTSVQDFLKRNIQISDDKITLFPAQLQKTFYSAGLFDSFGYNRQALVDAFTQKLIIKGDPEDAVKELKKNIDEVEIDPAEKDLAYNISQELYYLGTILRDHPLEKYGEESTYDCVKITEMENGKNASVFGFVTEIINKKTKAGKNMFRLSIEGKDSSFTAIIMGRTYDAYASIIDTYMNKVIKVTGFCKENNTIFANYISLLSATIKTYYMSPRSWEDILFVKSIKKATGSIPVVTLHRWNIDGTLRKTPIVKVSCFTHEEISKVWKHGIPISTKKVF